MSEIICASCGASLPPGRKFCSGCGTKVAEVPVSVVSPPTRREIESRQAAYLQPEYQLETQPEPQAMSGYAKKKRKSAAVTVEEPYVLEDGPFSTVGYTLTLLLFAIPVVGIVFAFIWALSKKTMPIRKRLALAQLIVWGIILVGILTYYIVNFSALNALIKVIFS